VSADERVRLFVALELPEGVRSELVRWRDGMLTPALRPVAAESLHLTLCFLGSQSSEQASAIGDACAAALTGGGPLPLVVSGAIWLPPRRPQVLAISLDDPSGELGRRRAALAEALSGGGWYSPERRPFLPHVTVARVRRGEHAAPIELPRPPALDFAGWRVALFRSHLDSGGARYDALCVIG
jgi:RNA 2',3'-cyclic 3'-phosphodiesterase